MAASPEPAPLPDTFNTPVGVVQNAKKKVKVEPEGIPSDSPPDKMQVMPLFVMQW